MADTIDIDRLACPLPLAGHSQVMLGHGSGGKLTAELVQRVFMPAWENSVLAALEDQATLDLSRHWRRTNGNAAPRIAFTTDSFVVRPLFFPGGDIGKLAVHGTVNDLAVGGAIPLVSVGRLHPGRRPASGRSIADRGLDARRVRRARVTLVAGDTKVVDRGKGDGVFITTSGIGLLPDDRNLSIHSARPGDHILVSGTIGDHGITILSVREGIEFETSLESDTASLCGLSEAMLAACPSIRCMRDPTRGGVSSALNELAAASGVGISLREADIPIRREVHAACEMLGLDPLYVANEGKLIAAVPAEHAERVLQVMREHPLGKNAADVGQIVDEHPGLVVLKSLIGGERVVAMLAGEQLPRIC